MAVKKNEQPYVGNDGYLYFTYKNGAKWAISTDTGIAFYEIIECIYREEKQSYTLRVNSEGLETYREMSLQRLNYLFSTAKAINELNEGTLEELPLTKAEVEKYYKENVKNRNKRRREANAKLKDDKEYVKLLDEEKALTPKWTQAIYQESATEHELSEKMQEIARKKREIMDKLQVTPADLKAPETCEICADKGITSKGQICACAYKRSADIKAYVSAERLVERRKEELLNVEMDSEDKEAES